MPRNTREEPGHFPRSYFTFVEAIRLRSLPKQWNSDLIAETRKFILDETNDDIMRFRAMNHFVADPHLRSYLEDFLDCFIRISRSNRGGDARNIAIWALNVMSINNEDAASALVSAFLGNDNLSPIWDLIVFSFPLDNYMHKIAAAIRDKTLKESNRKTFMRMVSRSVSKQSSAYNTFTSSTIAVAEDSKEDWVMRICAMQTLDPVEHRDFLWALKSDANE